MNASSHNFTTPSIDPTDCLDTYRTAWLSHALVLAVSDLDVGSALDPAPLLFPELAATLNLQARSASIYLSTLLSLDLLEVDSTNRIALSPSGREKLAPSSPHHLRDYISLGRLSADVDQLAQCLLNDAPAGDLSFVYFTDGPPSALDDPQTADILTRAMANRARSLAPKVQQVISTETHHHLLDVAGGHGLYSIALLQANPTLRATLIDRAPALKVASELATQYGVSNRLDRVEDDIHTAAIPESVDTILLANILHDYRHEHAQALVERYAAALPPGGQLHVMEAFLNARPTQPGYPPLSDGPKEVAAYGLLLASLSEGCCYRMDEVSLWLESAGLSITHTHTLPTHISVITATRPETP